MEVILCCFAAQRYWTCRNELEEAFDKISNELKGVYTNCVLIDEDFDIEKLNNSKDKLMIALPMSGAVQPNILKAAQYFGNILIYAGYVKNNFSGGISDKMLVCNAAPAVMDVYAVLKRNYKNISLCVNKDELTKRVRAICTYKELKGLKLLAIGDTEPWVISSVKDWSIVKERFGIEVVSVSQSELATLYESITKEDAQVFYDDWMKCAKGITEPNEDDVYNASRFQVALIKIIEKYNAAGAALACFNLLKTGTTSCLGVSYINTYTDYVVSCEGDMDSAVTMLIMKKLANDGIWMANPNIQPDGTVNFVHCTAPTRINGEKCSYILRNHHESHIGVSTQVDLPENIKMTACRISNGMSQMTVQNCIGSKGEYEPSCRTQLKIDFEDFKKYISTALGCHQLFAFGDIKQELIYLAELSGIEVL